MHDPSEVRRRPEPDDGYGLWLRYDRLEDPQVLTEYREFFSAFCVDADSPLAASARAELQSGLSGLLGKSISGQALRRPARAPTARARTALFAWMDGSLRQVPTVSREFWPVSTPCGRCRQPREACSWCDACVLYFQPFSGLDIPDGCDKPERPRSYYRSVSHQSVHGTPTRH